MIYCIYFAAASLYHLPVRFEVWLYFSYQAWLFCILIWVNYHFLYIHSKGCNLQSLYFQQRSLLIYVYVVYVYDWSSRFLLSSDHIWNIWHMSENSWGADRSVWEPASLSPSSTPCMEAFQPYTQAAAPNWQVYHPLANYCRDAGALTSSHHTAKVSQVDLHTLSIVQLSHLF